MKEDTIYKILLYVVIIILVVFISYKIYYWYTKNPTIEGFTDLYNSSIKQRFLWVSANGIDPWEYPNATIAAGSAYYINANLIDNTSGDVSMTNASFYMTELANDGTRTLMLKSGETNGAIYTTQAWPSSSQTTTVTSKGGAYTAPTGKLVTSSISSVTYNGTSNTLYFNLNYMYNINNVNNVWPQVPVDSGFIINDIAAGKIFVWITNGISIKSQSSGDWTGNKWVTSFIPTAKVTLGFKRPTIGINTNYRIRMSISNNYGWLVNTDGKLYYSNADLSKINTSDASNFYQFTGSPAINPVYLIASMKDMCVAVSTTSPTIKTTMYICSPNGNYKQIYLSSIIANNEVKELAAGSGIIAIIVGSVVFALNMSYENTTNNVWKKILIDTTPLSPRCLTAQPDWAEGWYPAYYHVSFHPDVTGTTLSVKYSSSIATKYVSISHSSGNAFLEIGGIELYDIYGNDIVQDPAISNAINISTDEYGTYNNDGNWLISNVIDGLPWTTFINAHRRDGGTIGHPAIRLDLGSVKNIAKIRLYSVYFNNNGEGDRINNNGLNIILRDANNYVVYQTVYNSYLNNIMVVPTSPKLYTYDGIYQEFLIPNVKTDSYVIGRYISFIYNDNYWFTLRHVEIYDDQDNLITSNYPNTHSLFMLDNNNKNISTSYGIENLTAPRGNWDKLEPAVITPNGPSLNKMVIDLTKDMNIKRIKIWSRVDTCVDWNWHDVCAHQQSSGFFTVIQNSKYENVFVNPGFNINDNNNRFNGTTLRTDNEQYQSILTNKLAAPLLAGRLFFNIRGGESYNLNITGVDIYDYNGIKYTVPGFTTTNKLAGIPGATSDGYLTILSPQVTPNTPGTPITSDIYISKVVVYVPSDARQRPNKTIITFVGLNDTTSRHTIHYTAESMDIIDTQEQNPDRKRKQVFILYDEVRSPNITECGFFNKKPRGWFNLDPANNYAKKTPESTNIDDYKYFCTYTTDAGGNSVFACNDPSHPLNSFITNTDGSLRNFDPYAIQPYYDFYGSGLTKCLPNIGLNAATFNINNQILNTYTPAPTTPAPTTPAPIILEPTILAPTILAPTIPIPTTQAPLLISNNFTIAPVLDYGQNPQTPNQQIILQSAGQPVAQQTTSKVTDINLSGLSNLDRSYLDSASQSILNGVSAITLEPFANPSFNDKIQTLESAYNAQQISVMPLENDTFKIQVNDQCLSVYGEKDYQLKKCDPKAYEQQFKSYEVTNAVDAKFITGADVIRDYDKANYPYSLISSTISNNCLSINDDGISVLPCNGNNLGQQWNTRISKNVCLPNEK